MHGKQPAGLHEVEAGTYLKVLDVSVRGCCPDLLHHGCHKVVRLKMLGGELLAALWAAYGALSSPPISGDAWFAEVVHTG